jgi:Major Facilitator Superfamily.
MDGIFGDFGARNFGMLMTTNGIVVVFLTTLTTYLTRRFVPIINAAIAGIFYAVGFGMLYFVHSMPGFFISTVIWTVGEILVTTNNSVYIAAHTPSSHRGRFNAILPFISFNLGSMLGPLVIGKYMNIIGVKNVWVVCSILAVTATVLYSILYKVESYRSEQKSTYEKAV